MAMALSPLTICSITSSPVPPTTVVGAISGRKAALLARLRRILAATRRSSMPPLDRFSTAPETMFFWHEDEDWAFSQMDFVQHGQNNSLAKDDYVYIYSPNGKRPHLLNLARVQHDSIVDRSAYRFLLATTRRLGRMVADERISANGGSCIPFQSSGAGTPGCPRWSTIRGSTVTS